MQQVQRLATQAKEGGAVLKAPLKEWKIFERVSNAEAIAAGLKDIPAHWSLTPLQDKSPRRDNWQTEPFIPHTTIEDLILRGDEGVSKKTGKPYYRYWSGFGLRTGEASGGLLAIDVDGESAQPLLEAISFHDIPTTVSWTSGKPGRYQLLFQIPDEIREPLEKFNRNVVTEWGNFKTARDAEGKPTELLEFRYNRSQSCLPPSRHPTTGAYYWINNPADVPVAIAPDWLCQLLLKLASQEKQLLTAKIAHQQRVVERKRQRQATGFIGAASLEDVIEQASRRLLPEEIFNWSGHNWTHQRGSKWSGYCPRHESMSGTAFQVNISTLEWFCHGCNEGGHVVQYRWFTQGGHGTPKGRDFVGVVRELANDAGIEMPALGSPQHRDTEPDPQLYAAYTAGEEEQERVAVAQEEECLAQGIRGLFKRVKRRLEKTFKGFGHKPQSDATQSVAPPSIIRYPQDPLPRPEDYTDREPPKIIFKKGKRLELLTKLKGLEWKKVCDRSPTGSGKSHDAGLLHPDPEATNKIWYFDQNHRNCSTETVEEMHDMPVRHNGLVAIVGKFTPKGHPHQRWASPDEVPLTPSLCHNAELFIKLKEKGYDVDSEKEVVADNEGKAQERNPICQQCRFAWQCHQETGEGYGYLYERRQAMEQRRIRASLDSAPNPGNYDSGYNYSSDTAFVEEASRHLQGTRTISAWTSELAELWGEVEREAPDAFKTLKNLRFALHDALEGKFDRIENGLNRGADHETLIEALPDPTTVANLPEVILQVRKAMPKVKDLVVEPDSVTGLGGKWRRAGQFARNHFKAEAAQETQENIEAQPSNVLVHILEIWAGRKRGSLRVSGKRLSVTIPDTRHAEILNSMKFVVLLDATGDKRILAKRLGVNPNTIIEIEQEKPTLDNLTVTNVNMGGMGSSQISEACKARQTAFLEWVKQHHEGEGIKVLGNKSDDHLPKDGHWFHDNRSTNAFKGVEVLVAYNTPRPNLGVIQDEYRALFGTLDGVEEYYKDLIQAEIVQLIGRQRAHLYPDKQFTLYLVGTNQDLTFLEQQGIRVVNKEAFELCPEAGTQIEQTHWRILQAFGVLSDQKEKLTQQAIAQLCGLTQGRLSQIACSWGGWKAFRKLLASLLGIYRGANNFSDLTEEEKFLAKTYLPLTWEESPEYAVAETVKILKIYGVKATQRILLRLPAALCAKLLAAMVGQLPWQLQREFEQLAAPLTTLTG